MTKWLEEIEQGRNPTLDEVLRMARVLRELAEYAHSLESFAEAVSSMPAEECRKDLSDDAKELLR